MHGHSGHILTIAGFVVAVAALILQVLTYRREGRR